MPDRCGCLDAVTVPGAADEPRDDGELDYGDEDDDGNWGHAGTPAVLLGGDGQIPLPSSQKQTGEQGMVGFLLRAAISALGLWVATLVLPGISFESPGKLAIAALLLGIVNAIVRPIAFVLTLPLTIVTLGLFLFVLNAAMVGLVARLVPGFTISGFWTAMGAAAIVWVVSWLGSSLIGSKGRLERIGK
jgi:putative membrane protein